MVGERGAECEGKVRVGLWVGRFLLAREGKPGHSGGAAGVAEIHPMAAEDYDNFNERLSQWVASQGFWFQMRFSMASGGSKGVVMVHLVRFATRLLLLLLVLGIGFGVYLFRLPGSKRFQDGIEEGIGKGLGAVECEMGGFRRVQGAMQISKLAAEGDSNTFFSTFEARNVRCRMGIFNSLPGRWNLGVVAMSDLDLHLNAGADDAESAGKMADVLFRQFGDLVFETVEVKEATVRWGYSERTRGVLSGTRLRIQRVPEGWRLLASGGEFTQNWFKRLEVVELNVLCTREEILFEKADFRKGAGRIRMDGLKIKTGERPEVHGTVAVSRMPIEDIIPPAARDFVDGVVTGDFKVYGSTNTKDGLGTEGTLVLDENNPIKLRDRIYLLRALTEFAVMSSFKMVEFNEGELKIKTRGGGMELVASNLRAGDLMTLDGQMGVRFPTPEEAAAAVERDRVGDKVEGVGMVRDPLEGRVVEDPDFTLKRAGTALQKARQRAGMGEDGEGGPSLFDRIGQGFEARRMAEMAVERQSRTLIYEGGFRLTVLPDTFETMAALRDLFPVDPATGRIPIDVPIAAGDIYSITYDQTEDLYLRVSP